MPLRSDACIKEFSDLMDYRDVFSKYYRPEPLSTHTGKTIQPSCRAAGLAG